MERSTKTKTKAMGRALSAPQNRALAYAMSQHKQGRKTFEDWPVKVALRTITSLVDMGALVQGSRKLRGSHLRRRVTWRVAPAARKAMS